MLPLPSREALTTLRGAAEAIVPLHSIGFVRSLDDTRLSFLVFHPNGVGGYVVQRSQVPAVLRPSVEEPRQEETRWPGANAEGVVEWLMALGSVLRVASFPVPGSEPPIRAWFGALSPDPLTYDQMSALEALVRESRKQLRREASFEEATKQLRRLEETAHLLPPLLHVLDVREVFDRLSVIAKRALSHDVLLLRVFSEDLKSLTTYAMSAGGANVGVPVPQVYPAELIRSWQFDIVDDLSIHPVEQRQLLVAGGHSALRIPIWFGDQVIGGLGFISFDRGRYRTADVAIGRRLADYVAVGLSHHKLAEEGRQAAALRERAANLEMLDGLLKTLIGVLDIREVFDRVSDIAQKVLPHDALSIAEMLPDGERVRIHASHGLGELPYPYDVRVPDQTMVTEYWEYRLIEDLQALPEYSQTASARAGMRCALYVSIRLEGKLFGGLNFYSTTPGHYVHEDVLVARRITDHVALALSHRRLAEQARHHEELRAKAERIDLLDELLAALTDSGELSEIFDRISIIARKVLPHDAMFLPVFLADGLHARRYVSAGVDPKSVPEVIKVPEFLRGSDWEYHIGNDLSVNPTDGARILLKLGFRSALRIPVRLEGRTVAAVVFVSSTLANFTPEHVPIGRRIANRIALSLSRERGVEASRRADEATERASKLEARVRALTDELDSRTGYRRVVGESVEWRQVLTQATQVAATETTVLLLGESGTGKEVVARFLHRASSRNNGPFLALNCAALPEQLLEAELFGYERGAYTGATQSKPGQLEQAAGGTLFLDEVGEMSPSAQAKFLRVLQEREFQRLGGTRVLRTDARIVAATNRDLQRAIATGQFREDLYYRLNVFAIRLPALRNRRDDILPLSEVFLKEIGRGLGRPPGGISREARQSLVEYHWPGNVRELRNILERAAILCDGGLITSEHLALSAPIPAPSTSVHFKEAGATAAMAGATMAMAGAGGTAPMPSSAGDLQSIERAMIEQALQNARFNKSKAAKALGLTRHQLYIRMRKYGFS
jgi:transcriptional regulator with GAF, ATPase, and Fis domain